ncbi:uncharacterized protein F5891DRAFT_940131 [Suillus fuscotomentosus]|uniref:Pentatricopeptide repeat-containing protein n=1 Tax=Suillus fuscotomentosus TaxID=1912939 RepID=A0AAD4EJ90_9AGAM|nr:uncharacterized protein F5891DRAFT_940131 [Suillus fuscotomentosus]KAG1907192.1 hypothetical protein F5891DRAFT_940131 [Suillus fuscotomentosus]
MISSQSRRTARNVILKLKQNNWWRSIASGITIDSSLEPKQGSSHLGRASERHQGHPEKARAGGPSNFRFRAQLDKRQGNGEGVQKKRLLKPYDLSIQLKSLCREGDLDGAIERLKSTPRDAQNIAVWNTMISECLSAERYQLSYDLFVDMKRRGFSPNSITFSTMLSGISLIKDWPKYSKQLQNAHSLYESYLKHLESVKFHEADNSKELSLQPLVLYIQILGDAGEYHKIFDVYFAMDQEGPLAPDRFVFTAMFKAISARQKRSVTDGETSTRNDAASDAKHVWMQMEKVMQRNPDFFLDPGLIATAIRALTRGSPNDQSFAFTIIHDQLGLSKPGEDVPKRLSNNLNAWTLDATLQLCNAMQKHRLTVHFTRQVMEKINWDKVWMRYLIDSNHIHKLLRAYAGLAALGSLNESSEALGALEWSVQNDIIYHLPKLTPTAQSYHLALMTCCRSADWPTAVRVYELMTGVEASQFESGGSHSPTVKKRSKGKNLPTDVETISFLLRTALAANNVTYIQHAMWLADFARVDALLSDEHTTAFYRSKLASTLMEATKRLQEAGGLTQEQEKTWSSYRSLARQVLKSTRGSPTPGVEEERLGNIRTLVNMDNYVAFEMASRSTKSRT